MNSPLFDTLTVSAQCTMCGATESTEVLQSDLNRYRAGEYIQVAFPEATPSQRELILQARPGGYFVGNDCGCWAELFATEEGDE